ncbi:hypothetical protein J6I39_02675 [bacterium]|nr:hypothetical protein [bacterium]
MKKDAKDLIKYFRSIGLEVHTSTQARGNQGFYMKKRIDVSKNIPQDRVVPVLLHEFAHYIHSRIEPFMEKTGGTLEAVFDDDCAKFYENELLEITKFVDKNSKCERLLQHKELIKEKIAEYEQIIKNKYPKFQRSKKFTEFNKYIKNSNAKYLLKYDRVKLVTGAFNCKVKLYTIDNIENDFTDMPKEFAAYIRLKSGQKKQARISAKINKMNKYYSKPTELFARFVESLYINSEQVKMLAPNCYKRFYELLNAGYYKELRKVVSNLNLV